MVRLRAPAFSLVSGKVCGTQTCEGCRIDRRVPYPDDMSETAGVRAEDQPSWGEVVRHAERGETVPVIAHGNHVADVVPSGELDSLRETVSVLSDTELVRDLRDGLEDLRADRVVPASDVADDLAARRAAGE